MKICPQCQTDYEDEQVACTECGCELLLDHGPDEAYPWTCVSERLDEAEAKPIAMYLNEHGVPAVIQPRFNAIFGAWKTVELWVPEIMADRAATLMQQREECPDTSTLFTRDENGTI